MVLPFILLGIGVVTGAGGVGLVGSGTAEIVQARKEIGLCKKKYDAEYSRAEAAAEKSNANLTSFGELQECAIKDVVVRMGKWLRRNQQQVRESERLLVDGVDSSLRKIAGLTKLDVEAASWVGAVVGSVATGAAVNSAVTSAVVALGTASTGTAISALSGAAATNATLAVLGGGAIAEGGGGMALGGAVLGTVAIGPALLFGGAVIKKQGAKAKTVASQVAAETAVEIAHLHARMALLHEIDNRAEELSFLLRRMHRLAASAIDHLESEPFVADLHAAKFQRAMALVVGVRDIAATPVLDTNGDVSEESAYIKVKYRQYAGGTDGD